MRRRALVQAQLGRRRPRRLERLIHARRWGSSACVGAASRPAARRTMLSTSRTTPLGLASGGRSRRRPVDPAPPSRCRRARRPSSRRSRGGRRRRVPSRRQVVARPAVESDLGERLLELGDALARGIRSPSAVASRAARRPRWTRSSPFFCMKAFTFSVQSCSTFFISATVRTRAASASASAALRHCASVLASASELRGQQLVRLDLVGSGEQARRAGLRRGRGAAPRARR